ncbi:MAG: hypothetical protein IAE77_07600 [Prosthecobacter sp.]|jgi:hypothetical protein|nr:hypothetical protein [Prosthecobacter sp.]MBE2283310.1 hypothetical protein [Prosthecobacter sp.]
MDVFRELAEAFLALAQDVRGAFRLTPEPALLDGVADGDAEPGRRSFSR